MKTIEFKLKLNSTQQRIIDSWLDSMRWVWNEGLSLLLEHHHYRYYQWIEKKIDTKGVRSCYLNFSKKNAFAATCSIARGKECYPVSPATLPSEPRLKFANYKGLTGYITKKRYPNCHHLQGIPTKFVAGTLKHLAESWKAYTDKKRHNGHIPKFKSKLKGDKITSLYCIQPEEIKILENTVKCPGTKILGELKVVNHGLKKRWDYNVQARTLQIVKRTSGYYLQLAGELPVKLEKPSNKTCGLDVGLQYIYSDDAGKQILPPRYYRSAQKRLRRLQRKLARQIKDSQNSLKTKFRISQIHEKIRLQRRNFNHKLSTYLVRAFGGIAVEDIQLSNLNRRPKPKLREDGKGWEHNNAKAKSGLNKSFADAGLGQLLSAIETKAKTHNREFIKVPAAFTSQDCPSCGNRQKKSLSQRTHRCGCGYIAPRDTASAIVIKAKADFVRSYPTLMGKVTPVKEVQSISVQQESTLVESGRDAPTIPPYGVNNRKQKKCNWRKRKTNKSIFTAPPPTVIQLELNFGD